MNSEQIMKKQKIDNINNNNEDNIENKKCNNCEHELNINADDDDVDPDNDYETCDICGFIACEDCADPSNFEDRHLKLIMTFLGKRYCCLNDEGCFDVAMRVKNKMELYCTQFLRYYDMFDSKKTKPIDRELARRALIILWDDYLSTCINSGRVDGAILFTGENIPTGTFFKYDNCKKDDKCEKCKEGILTLFCTSDHKTINWSFFVEKKIEEEQ